MTLAGHIRPFREYQGLDLLSKAGGRMACRGRRCCGLEKAIALCTARFCHQKYRFALCAHVLLRAGFLWLARLSCRAGGCRGILELRRMEACKAASDQGQCAVCSWQGEGVGPSRGASCWAGCAGAGALELPILILPASNTCRVCGFLPIFLVSAVRGAASYSQSVTRLRFFAACGNFEMLRFVF